MNYYEELGVRQDASIADIRHAYKMMARLLHPDRQVDPNLKRIAERQMKRLGEIVGLLADPRTRSQYDDILMLGDFRTSIRWRPMLVPAAAESWHGGNGMAGFAVRNWFWILIGAFAMALSTWSFMQPKLTVPTRELQPEASQRDPVPERRTVRHPAKPGTRPGIVKTTPNRLATGPWPPVVALPERHDDPALEDMPPVLLAGRESFSEVAPSPPAQILPPLPVEPSFAGRWLYWPRAGEVAERGSYPASYVELQLVEHGGEIEGDYHAIYKVHDQAVSPQVTLRIRGTAESRTSAKFTWVARDGAKGQAEMTLQGSKLLYLTWWTTAFGRQAALGSGTSVLIRQEVP